MTRCRHFASSGWDALVRNSYAASPRSPTEGIGLDAGFVVECVGNMSIPQNIAIRRRDRRSMFSIGTVGRSRPHVWR